MNLGSGHEMVIHNCITITCRQNLLMWCLNLILMKPMGHGTHGDVWYTIERAVELPTRSFAQFHDMPYA